VTFPIYLYRSNSPSFQAIKSPLPPFLSLNQNKTVSSTELWRPVWGSISDFFGGATSSPKISAKEAILYDLTTEKTLYEKNSKEKLPMASLTKIMTAIVAIEKISANDSYLVSKENLVGENSMGLTLGETLSLEELMYGLILNSGNDAAEVMASNYPGGRNAFVSAMNQKAKSLGLADTNFTNPTGLEGDGDQHTTAYDLLIISRYALKLPLFGKVAGTFDHEIPATPAHKAFFLQNETNLISSYPGVKGIKDGYTPEAGLCLATYLDYKGHKIIAIILGSGDRRGEMKNLLDFALKSQRITPPPHR